MPLGFNRTDLNLTHTNYRLGVPVTLPKSYGTAVSLPISYGNAIPTSGTEKNAITLPKDFGNQIQAGN